MEVSDEAAVVSQGCECFVCKWLMLHGWDVVFRGCQLPLANTSCPDVADAASAAIYSLGNLWPGRERCSAPAGMGFRVVCNFWRRRDFLRCCWAWEILISGQTLAGRTLARRNCWAAFLIPDQHPPGTACVLPHHRLLPHLGFPDLPVKTTHPPPPEIFRNTRTEICMAKETAVSLLPPLSGDEGTRGQNLLPWGVAACFAGSVPKGRSPCSKPQGGWWGGARQRGTAGAPWVAEGGPFLPQFPLWQERAQPCLAQRSSSRRGVWGGGRPLEQTGAANPPR